jgi:hypothetical protein
MADRKKGTLVPKRFYLFTPLSYFYIFLYYAAREAIKPIEAS